MLLRADQLTLGYGRTRVLAGVNLEVAEGELWFLLGPNGAGKTSFLRCVLGLVEPQAGRLRLAVERNRIGFVPQRCDLNPTLPTTVREFVGLGLVGAAVARSERAERLAEALRTVGLAGMERRDYWALSGGQRQRCLIARALIRRPALLILDEPTTGLDPAAEEALLRFLADVNERQRLAMLFVTHDVELAARRGSHVALFERGRVVAGRREEVMTEENLRWAYTVAHPAAPPPFEGQP